MYNKTKLRPLGKCKIKVRNQKLYRLEFQVVDRIPLLGRTASEAMRLIKVQYENILAIDSIVKTELCPAMKETTYDNHMTMEKTKTEFEDVFTGDGCLEGEYNIKIDNSVSPVNLLKRTSRHDGTAQRGTKGSGEKRDLYIWGKNYGLEKQHGFCDKTKWKAKDLHRPKTTESST